MNNSTTVEPKPKVAKPKVETAQEVAIIEPTPYLQHQYDRQLRQQRKIQKYQSLVARAF